MEAAFLKHALDASFDGVLIADTQGVVIYVNPQYETITGLKRSLMLGANLHDLLAQGVINRAISLEVLKTGKTVSTMHQYRGGKSALSSAQPVLDGHGRMVAVFNNTRNVDELLSLRNELEVQKDLRRKREYEINHLRHLLHTCDNFVFSSQAMAEVLALGAKVAPFDTTVTIYGESGTGKEVLSRYLHSASDRAEGPFIKVNCAAIPRELFESELFGYEKGAFTGASDKGRVGLFELANGGTLFLDEVGEMQLDAQSKVLRAIQEKEILRVGGKTPIRLNVRLVAATNRHLERDVAAGRFREDLFFRLNVFPITIPPLRERAEDIPLLIHAFMNKLNTKYNTAKQLTDEAMYALSNYTFPGNVRELENLVEYLFILSEREIAVESIPGKILADVMLVKNSRSQSGQSGGKLPSLVDRFEKSIIEDAVRQYTTLESAAAVLGIHYSTLSRKMHKYGLKFPAHEQG